MSSNEGMLPTDEVIVMVVVTDTLLSHNEYMGVVSTVIPVLYWFTDRRMPGHWLA